MATLILLKTPDGRPPGERIALGGAPVTIGRDPERSQVVLPINPVSRTHAEIYPGPGGFFIKDLESRNKTYVNNRELDKTPVQLKDGDGIKICDFLFCFRDEAKARAPEPVLPHGPDDETKSSDGRPFQVEVTIGHAAGAQFLDAQPSEKLRAILSISSALSKTLEIKSLMPQIADELFKIFRQADRCFIIEVDPKSDQLIPVVAKQQRVTPGGDRFSRTIVRSCLSKKEAYLSEDAGDDKNMAAAQSIAEFRIRSVMCVPLIFNDGRPWGVIQLDSQDRTKKFTAEDLKLLVCVAGQAAVAIENAEFHREALNGEKIRVETEAAKDVQAGFLPQTFPDVPGYQFYAHYVPTRVVGGDYYDFMSLPDGRTGVLLGDVSGKGVPAALLMARFSGEARVAMFTRSDLPSAITALNNSMMEANLHDRYVTLVATSFDPITHEVSLINAGHVTTWILRHSTRKLEKPIPESDGGFPIGWVQGFEYGSVSTHLEPGDIVILGTDGIYDAEAADGRRWTEDGFQAFVEGEAAKDDLTPSMLGSRVVKAVEKFVNGFAQFDDIALVCYGRNLQSYESPSHNGLRNRGSSEYDLNLMDPS